MPPDLYVHERVLAYLANRPPRPWEVGGWLIGYRGKAGASIVVSHHTPASGRGSAFGVTISGRGHRQRFDQIYDDSTGIANFLGDWHTHPAGPARPSQTDLRAMTQLASRPAYRTPQPLIAIVSTGRLRRAEPPEIRWWLRDGNDTIVELTMSTYTGPALPTYVVE